MSMGALGGSFLSGCLFAQLGDRLRGSAPNSTIRGKFARGQAEDAQRCSCAGHRRATWRCWRCSTRSAPLPLLRAARQKLSQAEQARRRALLFPLDNKCNWMVESAVHPGACAISEAMLCAGDDAEAVLRWAFDEQEEIVAAERAKAGSAAKLAVARFPQVAGCVGSSKAKARLNRALRWAVDNHVPVLTPQLYVNGMRMCDADTDLGSTTCSRAIDKAASSALRSRHERTPPSRSDRAAGALALAGAQRVIAPAPALGVRKSEQAADRVAVAQNHVLLHTQPSDPAPGVAAAA